MNYGTFQDGKGRLELSPSENRQFQAGKPVTKVSGDSQGVFTITVQLKRPRNLKQRFPKSMGYDAAFIKDFEYRQKNIQIFIEGPWYVEFDYNLNKEVVRRFATEREIKVFGEK